MDTDDSDIMEDEESSAPSKSQLHFKVKNEVWSKERPDSDPRCYTLSESALSKIKDAYITIGFDTEYQPLADTFTNKDVKEKKALYEVLSYQFYAINHLGDEWSGLVVPEDGKRISLLEFIVYALAKGSAEGRALPNKVVLVGHFNKADLPAFENRQELFGHLSNIRNSLVTLGRAVPIGISFDGDTEQVIHLHVRDTMQLAPSGKRSLAALGELIGLNKMVLAENSSEELILKKRMKLVRECDFELFERYAIRDAEVCAKYFLRVAKQYTEAMQTPGIPTALSSISLRMLLKDWQDRGVDYVEVVGKEVVEENVYLEKLARFATKKRYPHVEDIALFEQLATECYHGGRGEQMWFGPSFDDFWADYDLTSAYPTAMAMIGFPKWKEARYTRELSDLQNSSFGFALVKFTFPPQTRYPTLPIRTQNGLIFPLEGDSYCCAPEIQLALDMGCDIEVRHGLVVPVDENNKPFLPFIQTAVAKRNAAKSEIEELFWKEVTNSCYGKTAQGLREKRTYNLKEKTTEKTRRSKITNPFLAAHITSVVRAVIGEIINALPSSKMVFSVTTDGFITNATADELENAQGGRICQQFASARVAITGDPTISKRKHSMKQVLGWATRGQATLQPDRDEDFVLARGGIRAPVEYETRKEQNNYILKTFLERTPETLTRFDVPISFREMASFDADMVMKDVPRHISMEYDFKRKPFSVAEALATYQDEESGESVTRSHVAFSTVPWKKVAEFKAARRFMGNLRKKAPRCMKSRADYVLAAELYDTLQALGTKKVRYLKNPLSRLKRDLCRAFKHGKAGLAAYSEITAQDFANLLNMSGFAHVGLVVKRTDLENAARVPFEPQTTPPTADVLLMLKNIKTALPSLDASEILAESAGEGTQFLPALERSCPFIDRLRNFSQ